MVNEYPRISYVGSPKKPFYNNFIENPLIFSRTQNERYIIMANSNLLKEAIADAKAVRETAIANAKIALEEAFTPRLQSILSQKLTQEIEEGEEEEEIEENEVVEETETVEEATEEVSEETVTEEEDKEEVEESTETVSEESEEVSEEAEPVSEEAEDCLLYTSPSPRD